MSRTTGQSQSHTTNCNSTSTCSANTNHRQGKLCSKENSGNATDLHVLQLMHRISNKCMNESILTLLSQQIDKIEDVRQEITCTSDGLSLSSMCAAMQFNSNFDIPRIDNNKQSTGINKVNHSFTTVVWLVVCNIVILASASNF